MIILSIVVSVVRGKNTMCLFTTPRGTQQGKP